MLWFTLGGAVLGLPLFLWLDPLAIFSSAASVPRSGAGLARWYGGGMVLVLLLLDIARPRAWCRQPCPLGAGQDLVHDGPRLVVRRLRQAARVCPSGALRRVAPAAKKDVRIGLPAVVMDRCLLGEERECSQCRDWCPYGAIRYVFCEDDYLVHPRVDPDRCNGCGACEAHCPVAPVKAIIVHYQRLSRTD